jgi:hypothetical protein
VTQWDTTINFAYKLRALVDEAYPDVDQIVLMIDNLNIHRTASSYEAFDPEEALRTLKKERAAGVKALSNRRSKVTQGWPTTICSGPPCRNDDAPICVRGTASSCRAMP